MPAQYDDPETQNEDYLTVFTVYENGKDRRYGHLFAVNAGAFALVGFLADRYGADGFTGLLFGMWAFVLLPVGLGFFTWYMCDDIDSFGRGMRRLAGYREDAPLTAGIYRQEGRDLLWRVRWLFVPGWGVAAAIGVIDNFQRLRALLSAP